MAVERVESSYFDDRQRFPADSIRFDSALRMERIEHKWHNRPPLMSCGAGCVAPEFTPPLVATR